MKKKRVRILFLAILASFYGVTLFYSQAIATPSQIEVVIKVNEEGFFDVDGKPLNNLIEVPREQTIKLVFEHVGKPGEKHAFVLLFDSDEEIESGIISDQNRWTDIEFNTGDAGEKYDIFCVIVDCDGMEHLMDLVIMTI